MASGQPISSAVKSSAAKAEFERSRSDPIELNSIGLSDQVVVQLPEPMNESQDGFIGCLEVYIHQAREIHNICIYQKQDVYAKICLTSDPEISLSSQIVNGGGKNPVFNENLRLDVRTVDSSLKCEVWMLSRAKNYLEDQLLGFTLVPLSEILIGNGSLTKEFSLSSTDLFHSPAGFLQLSLSYVGPSPEVMAVSASASTATSTLANTEHSDSIPSELEKIEFPDLKVVKENQLMVSEYYGIPCDDLESQCSDGLSNSENGNCTDSDAGLHVVESFSSGSLESLGALKNSTSPSTSSVSTNGPLLPVLATSQSFSDTSAATEIAGQKNKAKEVADREADSSSGLVASNAFAPTFINVNIEPEQTVVQQEIVDMYMKSMMEFTESLAKMKLPMEIESSSTNPENVNSDSEQKLQASKGTGSRLFYGSRAFF